MYWHIRPIEVERLDIVDYRKRLFTIFNSAKLQNGLSEVKFQTEDEETNMYEDLIEFYEKQVDKNGNRLFFKEKVN